MPILSNDLTRRRICRLPELSLIAWAFFLNFFWEVVQTYFYAMKDAPFNTMLYGWIHCTLGDVILTLGSFLIVSMLNRSRKWFLNLNGCNFIVFIMIGVAYTIFSERTNVHVFESCSYNESMPIIPWLEIGLTPLLQWIVVPPIVLLLVRRYHLNLESKVSSTDASE